MSGVQEIEKMKKTVYETRQCGNYSCIATCSLPLPSNSLELAHTLTLARPPVGSHYIALARTRSHSLSLVRRSLASSRPNSLTFYRTRSLGAAKPFCFHFNFRFQFLHVQFSRTFVCVTVQNFHNIKPSASEILRLN